MGGDGRGWEGMGGGGRRVGGGWEGGVSEMRYNL